ncbi:MAG: hypothetical protein KUF79_17340 [Candidatus Thiodiazotropha sp. (ex Ctena orbiculata)]|nr:hypothetical protein [Candidatus Thiodiazotropha taylori]
MDWKETLLIQRDADSLLDWVFDWSAWLEADTIQSYTIAADPGITVDNDSHDDTTVTIWLSGGTPGADYEVTVSVTTASGRADDRTVKFLTVNK